MPTFTLFLLFQALKSALFLTGHKMCGNSFVPSSFQDLSIVKRPFSLYFFIDDFMREL